MILSFKKLLILTLDHLSYGAYPGKGLFSIKNLNTPLLILTLSLDNQSGTFFKVIIMHKFEEFNLIFSEFNFLF